MSGALAVCARELRAAFESPVAYVTIFLFVTVQAALFFFLGYPVGQVPLPGLWAGGQASLLVLFTWLPLLLAFLVPAITMGAWAEERRAGTEELLLTYPVRVRSVVFGKFLSSWLLVVLLIALAVLPVAWSVGRLGDLDWSTVWVGLAGAALLAAGYVAIALCLSASTSEQLLAFLLASLVLGGLWALRMLVGVLPASLASTLDYAAPSSHFLGSAARGVLDLRDVVYFVLLAAVGLFGNVLLLERRRWQ